MSLRQQRPLRIVVCSQWFPPEKVPIPADVAAGLVAVGHEVTVLTGFPNYPLGRTFDGWRQRPWATSRTNGYRVRRVVQYPSHDASGLRRAVSYLSFALATAIFAWRELRRADVVYVYGSPVTAALSPWLSRLTGGAPYVVHVQDLWPDSVVAADMAGSRWSPAVLRVLDRLCRTLYRGAAAVVCIAPTMAMLLRQRGVPDERVHTVGNWADEDLFFPVPPDRELALGLGAGDGLTVMYAGNMGPAQGLETAVRAAAQVADLPGFRLLLVGDGLGRPALEALAADAGAGNVVFCGQRPTEQMNAITAAADVQLVILRDLPHLRGTVPSKLGTVMASALPVLVSADGDARALVDAAGAGWTCPAEDVSALAKAFRQIAALSAEDRRRHGAAGRAYYEQHGARAAGMARIGAVLAGAARARHGRNE
jgi:colanic acid biosynthesis glycosyl transferase WcaI